MEGYNMRREEIHTLVGALECLEAPEEQFVLSLFKDFPEEELYVAHGDCYYLNTLYDQKNKGLCFIDFEYAS
jgi:thiamine kinase-like enzyme